MRERRKRGWDGGGEREGGECARESAHVATPRSTLQHGETRCVRVCLSVWVRWGEGKGGREGGRGWGREESTYTEKEALPPGSFVRDRLKITKKS